MFDGQKLAQVMDEQGRKAAWLGKQLGLSTGMISRILHGRRRLQPEQAQKAAQVLGIPLSWLAKEEPMA